MYVVKKKQKENKKTKQKGNKQKTNIKKNKKNFYTTVWFCI